MPAPNSKPAITIRELESLEDLQQVEAVEREVWGASARDTLPLTLIIASKAAGSLWIGAFDGPRLVGFAFALFGMENGRLSLHSHMLAVRESYRNHDLGYTLKLAQRERALALGIHPMTWTFDPLQGRNAHLNFTKLGVVSDSYRPDFYGPETSSVLHRNGTDRLWVKWPMAARRVQTRLQGKDSRSETLDALSNLIPLIHFNGDGKPARSDLAAALSRQRIAIEIPSDITEVERKNPQLAQEWRSATRWAFTRSSESRLLRGRILPHGARTTGPGGLFAGERKRRGVRSGAGPPR